jgi:hypothetical protein
VRLRRGVGRVGDAARFGDSRSVNAARVALHEFSVQDALSPVAERAARERSRGGAFFAELTRRDLAIQIVEER